MKTAGASVERTGWHFSCASIGPSTVGMHRNRSTSTVGHRRTARELAGAFVSGAALLRFEGTLETRLVPARLPL